MKTDRTTVRVGILAGALLLAGCLLRPPTAAAQGTDSTAAATVDVNMSPQARRAAIEKWKARNRRRRPVQRTAPPAGAPVVPVPAPVMAVQPELESVPGFQTGGRGGSTARSQALPFSSIADPFETGHRIPPPAAKKPATTTLPTAAPPSRRP